ncbi:MAG: FixG Ig-like domain-containing protein, partial [Pseudomonadota bacterium]
GVDIREGQQLACITCALCIDACDDVMAKIGRPRGLIDYLSLADEKREREGAAPIPAWRRVFRPRVLAYTALWGAVGLGLLFALFIRSDVDMTVAAVRNPVFVQLSDGSIRNAYDIRLRNKTGEARTFRVSAVADEALLLQLEGTRERRVTVPPDETFLQRAYLVAKPDHPAASDSSTEVRFWVEDVESNERAEAETRFRGRDE